MSTNEFFKLNIDEGYRSRVLGVILFLGGWALIYYFNTSSYENTSLIIPFILTIVGLSLLVRSFYSFKAPQLKNAKDDKYRKEYQAYMRKRSEDWYLLPLSIFLFFLAAALVIVFDNIFGALVALIIAIVIAARLWATSYVSFFKTLK